MEPSSTDEVPPSRLKALIRLLFRPKFCNQIEFRQNRFAEIEYTINEEQYRNELWIYEVDWAKGQYVQPIVKSAMEEYPVAPDNTILVYVDPEKPDKAYYESDIVLMRVMKKDKMEKRLHWYCKINQRFYIFPLGLLLVVIGSIMGMILGIIRGIRRGINFAKIFLSNED